jgi:SAM-dependent methyltransferase
MSTDQAWERWGAQEPYFGVITDPRFRRDRMTDSDREYFFATGAAHVDHTLAVIRQRLHPGFAPKRVLDYGCGVGRLVLPFARVAEHVTGIDVSAPMLAEARRHVEAAALTNVQLLHQGDASGLEPGSFDLVHSVLVLQHVDVDRGLGIFGQLLALLAPRGAGAIQITYAKDIHAATQGVPPPPPPPTRRSLFRRAAERPPAPVDANGDPVMLMNSYPLTPLFYQIQRTPVHSLHLEFTDHGGELGVFMFFEKAA